MFDCASTALRLLFDYASTVVRLRFDCCSAALRLLFDYASTVVRLRFDCCSAALRLLFDCASTSSRTRPEGLPNDSASNPEQIPTSTVTHLHQIMVQECTANVPLVYQGCTGGVLKRYQKGTEEVLKKYQKGTKDIPALRTSLVARLWLASRSGVGAACRNCAAVLLLIFCFSLFNDAAFGQSRPQSEAAAGAVSVESLQNHGGIVIGDSLPEAFWEQELMVVNHSNSHGIVRLSDYRDQLLIFDFLNTACVPCIASVDKWNELQPHYEAEISVLPIHLYGDNNRIAPFAKEKGWNMPIAAGNTADTIINRLFYAHKSFGQVWIKDGRLLAIPHNRDVSRSLIDNALAGKPLEIEMNDMMTYFDRRYFDVKQKED